MSQKSEEKERLKDMDLPAIIDTAETDFIQEFYNPALSRAIEYKRGVGYFTSGWMQDAARGIAGLAEKGGKAKWITSPILEPEDWEALKKGDEARRNEIMKKSLQESVGEDLEKGLEEDTLNTIAWMIADGLLDIKFAVPKGDLRGDFHDKWGIITGIKGEKIAFHGSQNDSKKGSYNYESYDIFCDWISSREATRVHHHERRFDEIWEGRNRNLAVYSLPEGISDEIAELRDKNDRPYSPPEKETSHGIELRDYQREAVDNWKENGRRGLFEMATGTGKTYTAIGAMDETIREFSDQLVVVISVPSTHLGVQWKEDLEDWGYEDILYTFGSINPNWKRDMGKVLDNIRIGIRDKAILITTHTTLRKDYFKSQIQDLNCKRMLIADEVHGLGSEKRQEGLIEEYDYRIGLSATPERYFDEEGTRLLVNYFGDIVFELPLGEAIPEHLTEYDYIPHFVEMTAEELEEYEDLTKKIMWTASGENDKEEEEVLERLAMKRADIVKSAENKFRKFDEILKEEIDEPDHLLVYTNSSQIDRAQGILDQNGIIHHKFTQKEDTDQREMLLENFDKGEYDALVAMKCLDEGVDVPSTRQAIFLSSTSNPKQYIQRRGRVLRHSEGKEKAVIHDIIVVPKLSEDLNTDIKDKEKKILRKELDRFDEFAKNARNEHEARNKIQKIRTIYEI